MVPEPVLGVLDVQHTLLLRLASLVMGGVGAPSWWAAGGVHRSAAQLCTPWLMWSCCMLVRVRMAFTD